MSRNLSVVTKGPLSSHFFMGNRKMSRDHCLAVTFAVCSSGVWTAGRASSGKWFTARFFATKNCTASRLKVWTSFLYPFAMCLLDFWSPINELLLIFGRLKWCTSTWWKQHGGPKQWTRSSNQFYVRSAVLTKEIILFQPRVNFFFHLVTEFIA